MRLYEVGPHLKAHLIYDAPVNEATKKLRERFDMDEETGYPRAYNWRNMARLGKEYKYEDPYLKFDPLKEEQYISQRIMMYAMAAVVAASGHFYWVTQRRVPYWSKLYIPLASTALVGYLINWGQKATLNRYNLKTAILIDYTRKHPERFGTIYRPKLRELLVEYIPNR